MRRNKITDSQSRGRLHAGVYTPHLLAHALSRDLNRPAVYLDDGKVLSAGDLCDLGSSYVQALNRLGIGSGTRVAVLSRNRVEVLYAMNALTLGNCCMTSLHPMGALEDFAYIVEDAGIEALIFDPEHFQPQAEQLQQRSPGLKHLLALGPTQVGVDLSALAAAQKPAPLSLPPIDGQDMCRLMYSGGTTGKPKGIVLSQQANLNMNLILHAEWEWPKEIRHLVCAPLSHSGQSVLLPVLMRDGALVVVPGFEPVNVMKTIQERRITSTLMVPTMIYAMMDHPRFGEFDLSSLETIFYGASSISPPRLNDAIKKLGQIFFQFYGQTEAPMSVTMLRKQDHVVDDLKRLASCGRAVPWVHVGLLDSEGREVADGEPGEICVSGPLVATEYWKKPDVTAEVFTPDWLHTGDVAVHDGNGFLRIVDRKKDMIVTGGFNVYPREIEDVIATHPAVAMVGVIGVADDKWGEAVKAVVVLRKDKTVDADTLIALVREKKGPVQAPKSVDFIDALPLSPLGKPDKKALRAKYPAPAVS